MYEWLNSDSRLFLSRDYLLPGQTPEGRIREIAEYAEKLLNLPGFANKFVSYAEKGWFTFSTPVWCNFGLSRGLPISCFGGVVQDDTADILRGVAEVGMMSKYGGGTSMYLGKLRPRGSIIKDNGTSNGCVSFLEIYNSVVNVVSQGKSRRGNMSAYYPIDGGDFYEFMRIREDNHPIHNLSIGVTIPDGWMDQLLSGDPECQKRWSKIIQKKFEKGYPYLFFSDNANKNLPTAYKNLRLRIDCSNLCSEIMLPVSNRESFVCCLGSLNLLHYDAWKDTDLVETYMFFLDAVLTNFIDKAKSIPFMEKAVNFSMNHRAVGLGVCGWHHLLQSKMIPFDSMEAQYLNDRIFKDIDRQSLAASQKAAGLYGEPPILKGYRERFATRMAIAPTTSSSFILGQVSQSIEPVLTNYFIGDLAKGKFPIRNNQLRALLASKGKDSDETWKQIRMSGGSVSNLDCLNDHEKAVFRTFGEISQRDIVIQAAQRQKYIDQGQSLNLCVPLGTPPKQVSDLMIDAWRMGIKTLYYQRGENQAQKTNRDIMSCASCGA